MHFIFYHRFSIWCALSVAASVIVVWLYHGFQSFGIVLRPDQIELFFGRLLAMLALYLLGFVFYLSKFPERLCPGTFDIWVRSNRTIFRSIFISVVVNVLIVVFTIILFRDYNTSVSASFVTGTQSSMVAHMCRGSGTNSPNDFFF